MLEGIVEKLAAHDYDGAAADCRVLLEDHPGNAHLHGYLGLCHFRLEQFEQAAEELGKATALEPTFLDAGEKLALSQLRIGRNRDALETAKDFLRIDPNNSVLRGVLLRLQMRDDTADQEAWERTRNLTRNHLETVERDRAFCDPCEDSGS